jgi:hypothetical protein
MSFTVQTVVMDRAVYPTQISASSVARAKGYKIADMQANSNGIRFRQVSLASFKPESLRLRAAGRGITEVIGEAA